MLLPGALHVVIDQANRDNSRWADFKLESRGKMQLLEYNFTPIGSTCLCNQPRFSSQAVRLCHRSRQSGIAVFPL